MSAHWMFFGDSNVAMFWRLNRVLSAWREDPACADVIERIEIGSKIESLNYYQKSFFGTFGAVSRATFVCVPGAMAGGKPDFLNPFREIGTQLGGCSSQPARVFFHFGHNDLDFLLWRFYLKFGSDVAALANEVVETYLSSIATLADEAMNVTVLGLYPVVVDDSCFPECLTRFGICPPEAISRLEDLQNTCPESRYEARVATRYAFNERLRTACSAFNWRYVDITPDLMSGGRVSESFRQRENWMPKLNLEPILPLWLDALGIPG